MEEALRTVEAGRPSSAMRHGSRRVGAEERRDRYEAGGLAVAMNREAEVSEDIVGLQLSYAAALAVSKTGVENPLFGTEEQRVFERVIEI